MKNTPNVSIKNDIQANTKAELYIYIKAGKMLHSILVFFFSLVENPSACKIYFKIFLLGMSSYYLLPSLCEDTESRFLVLFFMLYDHFPLMATILTKFIF